MGFAVSLGALAYFWSVGRLKEVTMCDLIFFSTLEKEKSVWSVTCGVEHKKDLSLLPQAHIIYWIFPCLHIVETKSNCLGIFSLFHSVGYATYDTIIILLDGLNVPTSLALSMQWSFYKTSFLLCGCFNSLCTFQGYLRSIYMLLFMVFIALNSKETLSVHRNLPLFTSNDSLLFIFVAGWGMPKTPLSLLSESPAL